jgi:hypothetical protein
MRAIRNCALAGVSGLLRHSKLREPVILLRVFFARCSL